MQNIKMKPILKNLKGNNFKSRSEQVTYNIQNLLF